MGSSSPLYLGLDLGTSGCRGILINNQEQVIAEARTSYHSAIDQQGHHQQDANTWWQAVINVLQQLSSQVDLNSSVALSIDGTSGSVLLCNEDGEPLHDALMYNDARSTKEVEQLKQLNIDNGSVLTPTSGLAKLLWLKQQPFNKDVAYFLHQADWLSGKLLNRFGNSDINNALKTGYDPVNKNWPEWFTQLDINTNWLPDVHQPGDVLGTIDNAIAKQLGLNSKTKIIAGTTDSTAAIIASGISETGEAVTSLGSTLVTKVIAEQPLSNSRYGVYSQPFGQYWLVGGASNSGGAVLKQFFTAEQIKELTEKLNPEKPTGLDYYPLPSTGERFPVNDPDKLAVLSPRPADDVKFFQGILEGIARIELKAYQLLEELGAPYPTHVITCGGGATNLAWCQIRKQVLNVPVTAAQQQEAAFGVALIAKRSVS